jgi:CRISPR-associated protein Cst2
VRRVGGNHARFLADYSPEAIALRWTDDPAPRFLYCFQQDEHGSLNIVPLLDRINGGDIDANEMIIGTSLGIGNLKDIKDKGATIVDGVKSAIKKLLDSVKNSDLIPNEKEGK